MKKNLLFLLITIVFSHSIFAQKQLSETEKLATTAKIWGFLKYYHPQVANGEYNWDEQLFMVLPKVKSATNSDELSLVYLDWINSLGKVEMCKKFGSQKSVQYFDKNFDLSWMNNNQLFTPELSEKLNYIEYNRHQGKKQYVSYYDKHLKIADIKNEKDYKDFDWQNENLRLLSLFRYWNIVEYFFPAKYQIDANWDNILNKMIPKFLNPKSETDFHLTMKELVVNLDDSHVRLNTKKLYLHFGIRYLPITYKIIDNKAVITGIYNDSLANLNNLKIGDIITKADGKTIKEIFKEEERYISGSNLQRKIFNASFYILNGQTDSLTIEYTRNGITFTKSVNRYLYKDFNYKKQNESEKFKILEGNIGYINIGAIEDVPETMEALKDTKAIIFDMRKKSTTLMYHFAHYIASPRKVFYKALYPDLNYPGKFVWDKVSDVGYNRKLQYKGKVVLIVDEGCQSQCEFSVMCLQTGNNTTTIGSQTSGADGNVSIFNMVGGYKTQMTGIGIFYPDETEAQRKGVKIDIEVKPTIAGVVAGTDEILERAIQFINE